MVMEAALRETLIAAGAAATDIYIRTARRPKRLRVGSGLNVELQLAANVAHADPHSLVFAYPHAGERINPIMAVGMIVDYDPYLPPKVWRLCDTDDTLLYDCREGTSAL